MSLWTFLENNGMVHNPHRRTLQKFNPTQRASFCICEKASYTLEAAVVIPLVACYLVTLLFFFSILEIQCEIDEALLYAGRKTAVESSVVDSQEVLYASAKAYLLYALQDSEQVKRHIKYGAWGITLTQSKFQGDAVCLKAEYIVELPISLFGIGEWKLSSQNYFRKWIGDNEVAEEGMVYITKYGEVYHTNMNCRAIKLTVRETSVENIAFLRGESGQKYYECTRCDWEDRKEERVYYTDYGSLFHKNIGCSAIKRIVEKVKLEEVKGRRPCSLCCEI